MQNMHPENNGCLNELVMFRLKGDYTLNQTLLFVNMFVCLL